MYAECMSEGRLAIANIRKATGGKKKKASEQGNGSGFQPLAGSGRAGCCENHVTFYSHGAQAGKDQNLV